ncbi:hypothetical protein ARMGADRAFT_562708 [Armillaria gallica]|uniref:FAD-binding PCMH-type domain-containing protein n=1 Tax=Armillaria gallica TaxID=47427 RepID=A0A2H3D1Q8_ARMGA|nr:hypothetical protein ARMGADRAFT_562708 [Armillaria gallica]
MPRLGRLKLEFFALGVLLLIYICPISPNQSSPFDMYLSSYAYWARRKRPFGYVLESPYILTTLIIALIVGGGHATNPGFSSTTGGQIAMTRFKDITYDLKTQTAVIGAGNIWDDVYEALNARGVNILGGRVSQIGVAGFTLGGGYSWLRSQHGLAIE